MLIYFDLLYAACMYLQYEKFTYDLQDSIAL